MDRPLPVVLDQLTRHSAHHVVVVLERVNAFARWDEGCDSVGGVDEGVERGAHGQARSAACVRCEGHYA